MPRSLPGYASVLAAALGVIAGMGERADAQEVEREFVSFGADVVATGNIGCITQLSTASSPPVVHTVELLDWALGGPRPSALDS